MGMIVLDTNAIIYFLNGDNKTVLKINSLLAEKNQFIVSTITELELFSFPNLSVEDKLKISLWLNAVYVVPVDSTIAQSAAELRQKYHLKTPDAIIAATAMLNGGILISSDVIFKKIKEIKLI